MQTAAANAGVIFRCSNILKSTKFKTCNIKFYKNITFVDKTNVALLNCQAHKLGETKKKFD